MAETDWLRKVSKHEWEVLADLRYEYLGFVIVVPAEFRCDLFSCVPNSQHPELWRSAILHDYMRQHPELYSRTFSDACFLLDMIRAGLSIYTRTVDEVGTKAATKELRRVLRMAAWYYIGVSGAVGSAYIGAQRLGKWFKKVF